LAAFSREQDEKLFWRTVLGKRHKKFGKKFAHLSLKFGVLIFGEIEWQFFRQMLFTGNFLLGEKSLVKLTPSLYCRN